MNKKGSNPLDRGLAWFALEAVPRAAPFSGTFFEKRVDVSASNRGLLLDKSDGSSLDLP
jgi:hypothetical protein